jgi:hypothetical protein
MDISWSTVQYEIIQMLFNTRIIDNKNAVYCAGS